MPLFYLSRGRRPVWARSLVVFVSAPAICFSMSDSQGVVGFIPETQENCLPAVCTSAVFLDFLVLTSASMNSSDPA